MIISKSSLVSNPIRAMFKSRDANIPLLNPKRFKPYKGNVQIVVTTLASITQWSFKPYKGNVQIA